ncbi:MAG: hypothetical protein EOO71_37180 [Myxococcaceae bacterium]|nr:MAG: hypothetical protein EOO71_37180 [Myxococcaceae bacterium]
MTQPGTFRLTLTALVLAALLPLTASAQMGGRPPGGNGIKVGSGRLHATLDLETRLDSGVGYFLEDDGFGPLSPDLSGELALHVRPGLMLDVPSQKLALSLRGNLDYVAYTGLLTPGSSAASYLGGMADLALRFDPEGTLSVEVGDQLTRSDRTRTVALGAGILSLYNEARIRAQWKPGVMAGVAGLVSPRITLTAKAGWSQNLGAGGGGNVVALAEGTYLWGPTLTLKGGYLRAFEPVAAYGTFRDDRISAEVRSLMGSRLALHAAGALDFITFAGDRSDTLVSLDLGPEYLFRPWLMGAVGYTLSSRTSSLSARGFNYTRNEGYARLSVTY